MYLTASNLSCWWPAALKIDPGKSGAPESLSSLDLHLSWMSPSFRIYEYNFCAMRVPTKFVLLVDDDPSDRKLFARYLEKLGLKVIATGDPEKAMQQIVAGNVGCIITHQNMQPSGHELVRIAKSVRSDIQLIFLSGSG